MSASKRGKNWTTEEDEALCEAWLNCSQDPVVGTNQKSETLYDRVFDAFIACCKEKKLAGTPESRAPSSIKARWHQLSKACSKFAGHVAQVLGRQKSGASLVDNLNEALALYAQDTKSNFGYMHAYKILEKAPKWKLYETSLRNKGTSPSSVKRKHDDEFDSTEHGAEASSSTSRPLGVKSAKAILENRSTLDKSSMELAKAAKLVAKASADRTVLSKQRTDSINRLADTHIMMADFSKLSEPARKYMEIQQKRILDKLQAEEEMELGEEVYVMLKSEESESRECDDFSDDSISSNSQND